MKIDEYYTLISPVSWYASALLNNLNTIVTSHYRIPRQHKESLGTVSSVDEFLYLPLILQIVRDSIFRGYLQSAALV